MKRIVSIILTIILLNGCNYNDESTNNQKNISKNTQIIDDKQELNTSKDKQDIIDLGEKFVPDDFLIKDFIINIEENKLVYNLKFDISEELYKYLSENNVDYYFSLEYPKKISKILEKTSSDIINHSLIDGKLSYDITFKEELPQEKLNDSLLDKEKYNLLVINKEGSVISIFDGVDTLSKMTKD